MAGNENRSWSIVKMEKYKEQGKCLACKKSLFDQAVTCPRCLEYSYCSKECMSIDENAHNALCTFVGLKKGILYQVPEEVKEVEDRLMEHAKLFDNDGNLKSFQDTSDKEDKKFKSITTTTETTATTQIKKVTDQAKNTKYKQIRDDGKKKVAGAKSKNIESDSESDPLTNGHFGDPLNINKIKVETGEHFGEGWWKTTSSKIGSETETLSSSAEEEAKAEEAKTEEAKTEEAKTEEAKTEEAKTEEAKTEEAKTEEAKTEEAKTEETVESSPEVSSIGMELTPYTGSSSSTGSDSEEKLKILEECFYCKKQSYTMLKCSRCREGRYCDKVCQKKDFPKHKLGCARLGRFITAKHNVGRHLIIQMMMRFIPPITTSLENLVTEFEYLFLGARYSLLVEIVGPYFHPFRPGAIVMDKDGKKTHVLIYDPHNHYYHQTGLFPIPIPLSMCLKPGNFMLLLDAHWHVFLDGTVGIRIDDINSVHFIFK